MLAPDGADCMQPHHSARPGQAGPAGAAGAAGRDPRRARACVFHIPPHRPRQALQYFTIETVLRCRVYVLEHMIRTCAPRMHIRPSRAQHGGRAGARRLRGWHCGGVRPGGAHVRACRMHASIPLAAACRAPGRPCRSSRRCPTSRMHAPHRIHTSQSCQAYYPRLATSIFAINSPWQDNTSVSRG